ncbi:F-box protein CPR1-like [Gossypium arboreum]|uniref:F-box protein CPR1-like n=1 Tax=Gossypium arboreum TaxID=29729 RepID=UPI0008195EB6|nr:F-box protein CPR1-like [Gossypium arboreum]
MAILSHDMTLDILRCLSVKDLLRFKCVSKFWCSWIDDPYFIKLHLSYSLKTNTNRSLIVRHCKYQFLSVNYDSPKITRRLKQPLGEQKKSIQILGSCNGLLAVEDENGRMLLWNPSTRKYQVLPSTEIEFSSPPIRYSRSTYCGFGYDPVSDDYKLVRIVQLLGANDEYFHSEAKVYSLRSNFWRRIKGFCFYFISYRQLGFLANNVLHWMVFKTPESSSRNLVGFDLRSEEFSLVELPDFCIDENIYLNVKAMGGHLCLTATYWELGDIVADVWIMKEYGVKESWVKLMSSTYPDLIPGSPSEVPLAFSKNGDKVLFHLKFNRDKRDSLVWYDLGSKRIEKVGIRGVPIVYDVDLYVESLVPLNQKPPRGLFD